MTRGQRPATAPEATRVQQRRAPAAERPELEGLVRHAAFADWLVLAVALLYLVLAARPALTLPMGAALMGFAGFAAALRLPALGRLPPSVRLELEAWATALMVTFVTWRTGGTDSPLQSLYLLPIVLAALVLPGLRIALLLTAIGGAYVLVAVGSARVDVATPAFGVRALGALGPFVLVAWLTAQLGSAALSARRREVALGDADALTGLASRRAFVAALHYQLERGASGAEPCAVLLVDLDGQRRLNEQLGQEAGNAALSLVADVLRRALRDSDLAARWGGDEFAALLPGADLDAANAAAQRIRNAVHAATLAAANRVVRCSVSVGAAASPRDGRDVRALVAAAEKRVAREQELRRAPSGPAAAAG